MNSKEKSRGILATLKAYQKGRKEYRDEKRALYREKFGPTLGDVAKDIADTAITTSYVLYDDTKLKASDFVNDKKDKINDWAKSFYDSALDKRDELTGKFKEVSDNIVFKVEQFNTNREFRRQMRAEKRSQFFQALKSNVQTFTKHLVRGRDTTVGAAIIAYDKGREIGREFLTTSQEIGSRALTNGRNNLADKLIDFSKRVRPENKSRRNRETEQAVTDSREFLEETPEQTSKKVNNTITDLRHGDKRLLVAEFATWYDSLNDESRQTVRDVLNGKRQPTDVVRESQQFRTKFGLDAKVGAIAFFKALKEPLAKDVLSVDMMKEVVSDMDTYAKAEAVIARASRAMSDIENKYTFLQPDMAHGQSTSTSAPVMSEVSSQTEEQAPFASQASVVEEQAPFTSETPVVEEQAPFASQVPINKEQTPFASETPVAEETVIDETAPFASKAPVVEEHVPFASQVPIAEEQAPFASKTQIIEEQAPFASKALVVEEKAPFASAAPVIEEPAPFAGEIVHLSHPVLTDDDIASLMEHEMAQ